jgi:anti-anti-sigma factor
MFEIHFSEPVEALCRADAVNAADCGDLEHSSVPGCRLEGLSSGRTDEATSELAWVVLLRAVRDARVPGVPFVVDLTGVEYLNSRGLRGLELARRETGGDIAVTLVAPSARLREILSISRFDRLFPTVESLGAVRRA